MYKNVTVTVNMPNDDYEDVYDHVISLDDLVREIKEANPEVTSLVFSFSTGE